MFNILTENRVLCEIMCKKYGRTTQDIDDNMAQKTCDLLAG